MHKIALTFDTELWHEGDWMQPYISETMRSQNAFSESIDALRTILSAHNHYATFFVTRLIVDTYPEILQTLVHDGHEIGIHGISHTRLHHIHDHHTFKRDLQETVGRIYAITGKHPRGFRAPHFSLDEKTAWLLPILEESGFVYDSSIFPIKHHEYGVAHTPLQPYRIDYKDITQENPQSPLLEIPPAIYTLGPIKIPISGGIYFRVLPVTLFAFLLKRHASQGFVPHIYLHPHELWRDTPHIKGPRLKTMAKYYGTAKSLDKFKTLSESFNFDSIEHIYFTQP